MNGSARSATPRISEAHAVLPAIRAHFEAAALRHGVPAAFGMLPVVDDDLFGYELLPNVLTHVYFMVGRNVDGELILRQTTYGADAPAHPRLAAVNGKTVSWRKPATRRGVKRHDYRFDDWHEASVAALAHLRAVLQGNLSTATESRECHTGLERAIACVANRLSDVDPFIQFFGLPNEGQLGFALAAPGMARGRLTLEGGRTWKLCWETETTTLFHTLPDPDVAAPAVANDVHAGARRWDRRQQIRRCANEAQAPGRVQGERRAARGRRASDLFHGI